MQNVKDNIIAFVKNSHENDVGIHNCRGSWFRGRYAMMMSSPHTHLHIHTVYIYTHICIHGYAYILKSYIHTYIISIQK